VRIEEAPRRVAVHDQVQQSSMHDTELVQPQSKRTADDIEKVSHDTTPASSIKNRDLQAALLSIVANCVSARSSVDEISSGLNETVPIKVFEAIR
jgi:hypothetical protein